MFTIQTGVFVCVSETHKKFAQLLLVVFVEVAPGRNRGIPGASKSRTTLPPYYTCHEGDVRWANISLGFAKYFIGFAKYSPANPGQQVTTCVTREAKRWGGSQ